MWDSLVQHESIESILHDKGLSQIGDNLVNFLYSLAKSSVLETASGEKVRDKVLAKAIRNSSLYPYVGRRTDAGRAADSYEAIIAWLWMKDQLDAKWAVHFLAERLSITKTTNRKQEGAIAAEAFQALIEEVKDRLP